MPFGPNSVIFRGRGDKLCMEVRDTGEHRGPVLFDLLSAAEASIRMHGLLTSIVGVEAGEECSDVMPVHCVMKAVEHVLRTRVFGCAHGCFLLLSPVGDGGSRSGFTL